MIQFSKKSNVLFYNLQGEKFLDFSTLLELTENNCRKSTLWRLLSSHHKQISRMNYNGKILYNLMNLYMDKVVSKLIDWYPVYKELNS